MDREGLNSETLHGVTHWMDIDEPEPPCTPSEGTRQAGCTLTDAEREAIAWAARSASLERDTAADAASRGYKPEGSGDPAEWARAHGERAATLRGLLERTAR
jgi:hypothetical protein